jgi:hypothetical protein
VHIEQTLERLQKANFKVKTTKCRFAFNELEFLGYIVSEKGIQIDDHRIKSIKDYPQPKNKKEVKQFLGLASYYRKFLPHLAEIAYPIN